MSTETKKNTYKKKVTLKNKKKLKPYEGGGVGEEEASTIKVLCWNIFWRAMQGKNPHKDGQKYTQKDLFAEHCGIATSEFELNECAKNVKDLIDADTYDFVALQEASKWKNIYDKSENLKNKMGYVHYKLNKSNLVTFYDKTKYTLIAFNTGILSVKEDGDDRHNIRPYHILLLHDLSKNYYIFINLHAPHNITKDAIERQLSNAMEDFYAISDETEKASISEYFIDIISTAANIQNINTRFKAGRNTYNTIKPKTTQYEMKWDAQNYNIIVAGDFNDTEGKFWRRLQPFKYSNITILNTLEVKLDKKPPHTCCSTELVNPSYTNIGDYILVNKTLTVTKIDVPILKEPASDHLPIIIYIRPTSINSEHKEHVASHAVVSPAVASHAVASPEPANPEDCIPTTIHVFNVPGDGACLFSSLLHGLIRLKEQSVSSMDLKGAYNKDTDIPEYVRQNVQNFRMVLVDAIELLSIGNEQLIWSMRTSLSETPRIIRTYQLSPEQILEISDNNIIREMYLPDMRLNDSHGDETIITILRHITNINIVIFDNDKDAPTINIGGKCCYNGIWLHYNHVNHYKIIFPIHVNNSKYKDIVSPAPERLVVDRNKIRIIEHPNYEDIINMTREDEVIAQPPQAPTTVPTGAAAAAAQGAPLAKAPPAKAPQAKAPAPATALTPAPATALTPAPATALTPAPATALTSAPKKPPKKGKTPTKKPPTQAQAQAPETGSETGAASGSETGSEAGAETGAPTGAPTPTPEPGSETGAALAATLAATTLTPTPRPTGLAGRSQTRRTEQSHGEEPNGEEQKSETPHPIEPISGNTQYDESYSNNMFFIPLIGAVLALSLTFIITK